MRQVVRVPILWLMGKLQKEHKEMSEGSGHSSSWEESEPEGMEGVMTPTVVEVQIKETRT